MLYCIDIKKNVVHVLGCRHIPQRDENKIFLNRFKNPKDAVADAKAKGFFKAKACSHCSSNIT